MNRLMLKLVALLSASVAVAHADTNSAACAPSGNPTLQVLGSGGPIADDGRASSGYLVWIDGKSRFLIDAGGGVFLRFGEAGARFEDLEHIAVSHFHTDHSGDLSALLKSGYFSNRTDKLSISGPAGNDTYPGMREYLERLLAAKQGAYAYLDGYLDGSAGLVKLAPQTVDAQLQETSLVYTGTAADIEISAIDVPHGPVPALAYRIRIGGKSITFAGDQNGSSDPFIAFARGTDVLVMHMPVPEGSRGISRNLHAPPSRIGEIAAQTGTEKLVLSHFMARSLADLDANLEEVRSRFDGEIVPAHDLDCVEF
jgi:ribonuclease BN (tRNA processing enzyme)